jgi:hypothetical protein
MAELDEGLYAEAQARWRRKAVQIITCTTCSAGPTESCLVTRGPNAGEEHVTYVHNARLAPLHEEFWAGRNSI